MRPNSVLRSILVVMLGSTLSGSSPGAAQDTSSALPGISVIGHGEARAPADTATIQLVIGDPNYGGPVFPQAGGTPGERETVAPIVEALIDAGVPEDEVEVIVGPSLTDVGTHFGPAIALIIVVVDSPEREQIADLVDTAAAAADDRLVVGRTNAVYAIEDCSPLEREAREMAVANAQDQADIMAELVGVSRGNVIGTRDLPAEPSQTGFNPYHGPVVLTHTSTCGLEALATTPHAIFLLPLFDPTVEPEVTASAVLELTSAITGSTGATPAP